MFIGRLILKLKEEPTTNLTILLKNLKNTEKLREGLAIKAEKWHPSYSDKQTSNFNVFENSAKFKKNLQILIFF